MSELKGLGTEPPPETLTSQAEGIKRAIGGSFSLARSVDIHNEAMPGMHAGGAGGEGAGDGEAPREGDAEVAPSVMAGVSASMSSLNAKNGK